MINRQTFEERLENKWPKEYKLLTFNGMNNPVVAIHKCGYKRQCLATNLLRYGCTECSNNHFKKGQPEYIKQSRKHRKEKQLMNMYIPNLEKMGYTVLSEYEGWRKKLHIKCNKCGEEHFKTLDDILFTKQWMCECRRNDNAASIGEYIIAKWLRNNYISYMMHKRFEGCKYKTMLSFDFYIQPNILIEYNGKQHYQSIEYYGGIEQLQKQQARDSIKKQWAKDNGFRLIIIKYDDDIERQLELKIGSLVSQIT